MSHPTTTFNGLIDLVQLAGSGASRLYDINDDGQIDTADVNLVLDHLFDPVEVCPACDANCDGSIDLDDVDLVALHQDAEPVITSACD